MFSNLPRVTKALLIANTLMFVLQLALDGSIAGRAALGWLELRPISVGEGPYAGFMPWQLLTYGFMHGDLGHLIFNMLAVLMFGATIEHEWGQRRYATYYFVCLLGAGLCQLFIGSLDVAQGSPAYSTIGASGAVYGLLLAYGMLFPHHRITLLPFPIVMKARTVVILYAVTALLYGILGTRSGIAHFAHLGGMLFGWLLIRYWRRPPPSSRPRRLRIVK